MVLIYILICLNNQLTAVNIRYTNTINEQEITATTRV
jgi:hypothetical protein